MMPPISAAMQRRIISRKSLEAAVVLVSGGVIAVIKSRLTVCTRASNEGYPKVPNDFTIMENAPTRAFSWMKAPISPFSIVS